MPDLRVALSDTWTWRGPVAKSSPAHLSRVVNGVPPRESTPFGSNDVCEWAASPIASSREYGSDLDDAIAMSLSEFSSGDGGGGGGGTGTGGGLARRDTRSSFDENLPPPGKMTPRSGGGRLKSAEAPPNRRGGSSAKGSTWAPFCGGVCVEGTAFLDQHEAAAVMARQSARLGLSAASSASTYSRPGQSHRSSLPAPRLSRFFPDDGNISSSSSSSDGGLKRGQSEIWDDTAKATGVAQKRQGEGRRGSVDSRQSPRGLPAKAPCAAIGILRGRDERRRRQRRQLQREQRRLRQAGPGLGRSDSDQEQAWGYWARSADSIRHTSSESLEMSPSSSPTLLSPLNCKAHTFETLRSAYLSADVSGTANGDKLLLGQENDGSEGFPAGGVTSSSSYFPPTANSSTGELLRHRTVTRGSSAERLPEDGAQRADPSAPRELLLSPVGKMVPVKESPVSTVAGSRWGVRLMVDTDRRAATVAAAAAAAAAATAAAVAAAAVERQPLVECSDVNPGGADNVDSVVGFGPIDLCLRDGVGAVARALTVVDPAAASTVDNVPHGSLVTVAAAAAAPSPPRPPPPAPSPGPSRRPKNRVYLSCSRPSSFQRLPQPRAIGAGVASADAVAEPSAELSPERHVGDGGSGSGGGGGGGGSGGASSGGGGSRGSGDEGIEKRERKLKGRKKRLLDNGRGFCFGYGYDHDYNDFRAMWSPGGGGGGSGWRREAGRGRGGEGERGGRGGGGGAGTSGARYSHRGCGTAKGPGRPKSIWPTSPSLSQQQKAQSGPCPRRGMIWSNDDNGCTFPPPPPSLLRLNERRLRAGSRVRVGKGLSGTSATALEVVSESGTGGLVGPRTAPPLPRSRKEDGRRFGREFTNRSNNNNNGNDNSTSNNSSSSSSNKNSKGTGDKINNNNNNAVNRADKREEFMLTE